MNDTRTFKRRTAPAEISKISQIGKEIAESAKPPETIRPPASSLAPAQGIATSYAGIAIGATIEVPPSQAKPNPFNARHVKSQSRLDELAVKIRSEGQHVAALAYINDSGEVCLIDGHRRQEACRLNGVNLRVEIHRPPENDKELYRWSRAANKDRDEQTPMDDALAWKKLLDEGVYKSQTELCSEEGLDMTTVSRTLALADMPKTLIGMLADRPDLMTLRMLDAINRFYKAAEESNEDGKTDALNNTEGLILEIDKEGMSSRDVDSRRKALQKGPVSRKRSEHQTVTYERGQAVIKRFAGQGRLVLEVTKVVDEESVEILEKKINAAIREVLDAKH